MFCGNCGTPNNDSSVFCANCGARLQESPAPVAPEAPYAAPAAPAPKKRSKAGLFIGLGAAAVATLAIVLVALFCFRSPKATVNKFFKSWDNCNAEALMKLFPQEVLDEAIGDKDDQQDYIDAWNDYLEAEKEDGYSFEFKILDVEDVSASVEESYVDYYERYYDLTVKDVKVVTVKINEEYDGETDSYTIDVYVIKVGTKWYMDDEWL